MEKFETKSNNQSGNANNELKLNKDLKLNPERNLRKCPPLQSQYNYTYFMISLR